MIPILTWILAPSNQNSHKMVMIIITKTMIMMIITGETDDHDDDYTDNIYIIN